MSKTIKSNELNSIFPIGGLYIKKIEVVIFGVFLMFSIKSVYGQVITETSELKLESFKLKYYSIDPCENLNEISSKVINKVAHFVRFESCQEDHDKLKGIVFGVIIIEDTLYKVPIETADQFLFGDGTLLNQYRKLDISQRLVFEKHNLQLNSEYFKKLEEENRRLAEENRRIEIEKKRIEDEQIAEINAQRLAFSINKAKTDSLTNEEMKKKIVQTVEFIKNQDAQIEAKIKTGVENGGILITQFSFSVSDYGVVDLRLGIKNVGKKRIKYATFNLQPFNSVDDPVEQNKSFKGIGFIEPNEEGVWNFESAWFSDVIETLKLKSITLLYDDGGTKVISKIAEIRVDDDKLLESIKNRQRDIPYQFGSVVLIEFKDAINKMVGLCFYSVSNEEFTTGVFPEEDALRIINELSQIIQKRKNDIICTVGNFEVLSHSSMIYFYLNDGYCLLSLMEAENLLKKLEELF